MLVDGKVKRICITKVDGIKEVTEIPKEYTPTIEYINETEPVKVTNYCGNCWGAGPAGLACREILNQHNIFNIVIDNNDKIGGQFLMQTHQFFSFF